MLLALAAAPMLVRAQCECSDPTEGGVLNYTIQLPRNNFSTNVIKVPKLDPNIGQVTCVDIDYTYSLLSTISVTNKESIPKGYRFLYNVNPSLTIGSTSHSETFVKYYPSISTNINLDAFGDPLDSHTFGPDTIALDNSTVFASGINPAHFSGSDSASLIFEFSGGVNSILGGVNYQQIVTTESWGEFRISISWCPNEVLNDDLKEFSAKNTFEGIQLNWKNSSESELNQYVVQISKDGVNFIDYITLQPNLNGSTEASYQYTIEGLEWDKVFVRVKLTTAGKSAVYTPIKQVQKNSVAQKKLQVSPNPANSHTNLIFPEALTGQYRLELIGVNGQVAQQQTINLVNQSVYNLKFQKLAAGVYYLRIVNVNNTETFVTKVYISN